MAEFLIEFSRWQWLATGAAFLLFAGIEAVIPFRSKVAGRRSRWFTNLGLYALATVAAVLVSPMILTVGANLQQVSGFPPLVGLGLPAWLLVAVSFLLIDLIAYLNHVAFHGLPWLWQVHQVHHSDGMLDASTGVRHHPVEAVLSSLIQLMVFAVLGLPLLVVLAYGVVAVVWQFFAHANLSLPDRVDRLLRGLVVTPGMHRVHHSVLMHEGNSNFGMVLSIWDRLFGTYRVKSSDAQADMAFGLEAPVARPGLIGLLARPFKL